MPSKTMCACLDVSILRYATGCNLVAPSGHDRTCVACVPAVPGNFPFSGWPKGQSTMELLAAYSIARQPVDVVLTDAHIYHILRLRSKRIIYWPNLSTAVALAHLASYLHQASNRLAIADSLAGRAMLIRVKVQCICRVARLVCQLHCQSRWTLLLGFTLRYPGGWFAPL